MAFLESLVYAHTLLPWMCVIDRTFDTFSCRYTTVTINYTQTKVRNIYILFIISASCQVVTVKQRISKG